ncbi:LacI family transcriptional regulator [Burkholderia sp. Ac-20365]|nr:LacI family transcriptional regulator [Burkholderia sp. Ac-20365]
MLLTRPDVQCRDRLAVSFFRFVIAVTKFCQRDAICKLKKSALRLSKRLMAPQKRHACEHESDRARIGACDPRVCGNTNGSFQYRTRFRICRFARRGNRLVGVSSMFSASSSSEHDQRVRYRDAAPLRRQKEARSMAIERCEASDLHRRVIARRPGRMRLDLDEHRCLVGLDDIEQARLTPPPLTTVRVLSFEIGMRAARHLIASIDGPDGDHEIAPDAPVVERGTLARPKEDKASARR